MLFYLGFICDFIFLFAPLPFFPLKNPTLNLPGMLSERLKSQRCKIAPDFLTVGFFYLSVGIVYLSSLQKNSKVYQP